MENHSSQVSIVQGSSLILVGLGCVRLGWAAGRLGFRGHPQNRVTGIWGQIGFRFFNLLSLIIETFSVAYPGGIGGTCPPGA